MLSRFARLATWIGHARARHLLLACGLLVGLTLTLSSVWFVCELRRNDLADTQQELTNLALALAEETDRSFQAAELVQNSLIEHMRQIGVASPEAFENQMASREVYENLRDRISGLPDIDSMALTDVSGRVFNNSRSWPPPVIDASGREFVTTLIGNAGLQSFIGEPAPNRANGTWTIPFARKFTASDGRLLGLVSVEMRLAHFEEAFARISLDGDGSFEMYRNDGMLLAHYPHMNLKIGNSFSGTAMFDRVRAATGHDVTSGIGIMDGRDELIAAHAVTHYPMIIAVSRTVEAVLAPWRSAARIFATATALLDLVIALAVLLAIRHLRGYERLQTAEAQLAVAQERERSARVLETQWAHFDMALRNMRQGLCMYDRSDRVLVANRRFTEIFGVSPEAVLPGTEYRDVIERVIVAGRVTADDVHEVHDWRGEVTARRERATHDWELASGRTLTVTHQPMQDGWLTTYEDITERRQTAAKMAHMARHDALTNLPNRILFRERLETALAFVQRGRMLALLCLDLDQFKAVNDTLGHPVGDSLLKAVGQRLADAIRTTDTVARLGGDEFAIVQTAISAPTEATTFASRLIDLLGTPFEADNHQIVMGVSIGIAFAPQDGVDVDQLLRCADLAMYRAKGDGRGVYRLFHAEMDAQMQARRLLELDLRQAVLSGQLEVFYQPSINLREQAVAGFEALLRWRHPRRGMVPPSEFIPLAEEIGLIAPIGEWVLRQACDDAASWPGTLTVAVNLSSAQFRHQDLLGTVAAALCASSLPPSRLEVEITETVMLEDTDATLATLRDLRALGVRIAMDDFGTGYSSLSYLRCFPFDRIKIDQSFVRELGKRRDCSAIVRAVADLSGELGMATTAEGVETREQLDALTAIGCTEVQGYLFSPAVPGGQVPDLLRRMPAMIDQLHRHEDAGTLVEPAQG
jgi:diguanylate cyclase (GGDEF)-like protein/PAS domain S-box-containing protein